MATLGKHVPDMAAVVCPTTEKLRAGSQVVLPAALQAASCAVVDKHGSARTASCEPGCSSRGAGRRLQLMADEGDDYVHKRPRGRCCDERLSPGHWRSVAALDSPSRRQVREPGGLKRQCRRG